MSLLSWLKSGRYEGQKKLPNPADAPKYNLTPKKVSAANEAVTIALTPSPSRKRKAEYNTYTDEQRAKIAKHAVEHGVASARRKFEKVLNFKINESSVRAMRDSYKKRMSALKEDSTATPETIAKAETSMPKDRRGRPLTLGETYDEEVQSYVRAIRDAGGTINTAIVRAAATGIVSASDPNILLENGGHVNLGKDWALSLLKRMHMVKRKASTSARTTPDNFEDIKTRFLEKVSECVAENGIPESLIINFDQTGLKYVPCAEWTMATEGEKRVEVAGLSDKRMITAVVASTASAELLPPQLIYDGKTDRCLPAGVKFPDGWHVTHSESHWSTNDTMMDYANKIIIPYVERVRDDLPVHQCDQKALVILDMFKCHQNESFISHLKTANIEVRFIPANCTDALQPQDIAVNKPIKDLMRAKFHAWYADRVKTEMTKGTQAKDVRVSMKTSEIKPIHARWVIETFSEMSSRKELLRNAFRKAGIIEAVGNDAQAEREN